MQLRSDAIVIIESERYWLIDEKKYLTKIGKIGLNTITPTIGNST